MIPCAKSELLLFNRPSVQVAVDDGQWLDIHPINSIQGGDVPIEFFIPGSDTIYLDLNDTLAYVRCKISQRDGTAFTDANDVAPVNLLLSSLFSDVELKLNDTRVEGGTHLYAYNTYLNTLLNFSSNAKQSQLRACGWSKDDAGLFNGKTNPGHKMRAKWVANKIELMGALNLSLFQQSKYILPGVSVSLKFTMNKPDFCIMNFGRQTVKLEILEMKLFVRRARVNPSVLAGHEEGLLHSNAIYPIIKQKSVNYTLSAGTINDSREVLIGVRTPRMIVVGFVDNEAFNGNFTKNPFNFEHFHLGSIALLKDGFTTPYPTLELDYEKGIFLSAYTLMLTNLGFNNLEDKTNDITIRDFSGGNALYVFNLNPDLEFAGSGCTTKPQYANLRLDLAFKKALTAAINVIIMAVHDETIEIMKDRKVVIN